MHEESAVMRALALAALVSLVSLACASGQELKTSAGQPFCFQMDQLREYFLAMVQKDEKWMKELDCYPIVAGAKVTIIEEYPSELEPIHVVKVRIFSPKGAGSVVGYTFNLGIEQK
jgi:hypothetical protein